MFIFAFGLAVLELVTKVLHGEPNLVVLRDENNLELLALSPIQINRGANLSLVCKLIDGGEQANDALIWMKKTEKLENATKIVPGRRLRFIHLTVDDQGEYVCKSLTYKLLQVVHLTVEPEPATDLEKKSHNRLHSFGKQQQLGSVKFIADSSTYKDLVNRSSIRSRYRRDATRDTEDLNLYRGLEEHKKTAGDPLKAAVIRLAIVFGVGLALFALGCIYCFLWHKGWCPWPRPQEVPDAEIEMVDRAPLYEDVVTAAPAHATNTQSESSASGQSSQLPSYSTALRLEAEGTQPLASSSAQPPASSSSSSTKSYPPSYKTTVFTRLRTQPIAVPEVVVVSPASSSTPDISLSSPLHQTEPARGDSNGDDHPRDTPADT